MNINSLISAAIAALVLYLFYFIASMLVGGTILKIVLILLVLVFIGYLLKLFGVSL